MPAQPIDDHPEPPGELTQWLDSLGEQDGSVSSRLFELLYQDLRRVARRQLSQEAPGHTLATTGLLHEAWFRMVEMDRTHWRNRGHYLAVASMMMRRILVNHALARRADKRGGGISLLTLSHADDLGLPTDRDVVAVNDALLALEAVDARAAKVVELRYFGGLDNDEIAEATGVSLATVKRDWVFARAWLHRALSGS